MNDPFSLVPHEQAYTAYYGKDQKALALNGYAIIHLRIRLSQLEDLASVAALLAESFYPPGSLMSWLAPLFQIGIHQELRSRLRSPFPNQVCLVAFQDASERSMSGNIAGTIEIALRSLSPWQLSASKYPYISNLAVKPDYRRQGVAQRLLLACEKIVLGWGCQDLYLHVLENNQPARQLYTKIGYQEQGVDWVWPQFLFGQARRLLLHKHL